MKKALCVGINNYPGTENDLNGCVNDMYDWGKLFVGLNFDTVSHISDSSATKSNIKTQLRDMIASSNIGDVLVFSYSGHGTSVLDESGDEEIDGYDEALYVYDGVLLDDELRSIISMLPYGVKLIIMFDSCFSGTATKAAHENKIRYMETDKRTRGIKLNKSLTKSDDMKEIFISGCSDSEYSYDAYINGRYNGAFTHYAISCFNEAYTYADWYNELQKLLPSVEYPQSPGLEGSIENINQTVFTCPVGTTGIPEYHEEPAPTTQEIEYTGFFGIILKIFKKIVEFFKKL